MALMSRGVWVRFLLVIGLLVGCGWIAVKKEPVLGLDLRGGTQIMLQAESTEFAEANAENTDLAIEVLSGRVNALGVSEPTLVRVGEDRILVELPDVHNAEEAQEVLGRTAELTVRPVVRVVDSPDAKPENKKNIVAPSDVGDVIEMGPVALRGSDIRKATATQDPTQGLDWKVNVDFSSKSSKAFGELSKTAACETGAANRIAILLDKEVITSPGVTVPCGQGIFGSTEISGNFTVDEANQLAVLIQGGALPLPVTPIDVREIGPTLGAQAIEASFQAGVIGLILTGLFIIAVYRLVGALATMALASYALLAYAALVALEATLTLPGLAGFVLAIGLAIDANVLVFEAAREEYALNKGAGLRAALMKGFNRAWTAIIDSNVTTLLAAALLFWFGTGPIKGFGVTLVIGVVASMVSALIIARVLTELGVSIPFVKRKPAVSGIAHVGRVREWINNTDLDLMKRRKLWLTISAVTLLLALGGIFIKGLNLGLEFTGGRVLEYSTSQTVTADQAREAISEAGFPEATVQTSDAGNVTVRVGQLTAEEAEAIEEAVASVGGDVNEEDDQTIAPSLGRELRDKALIAFGLALLVQMAYMAVRFKWTFGLAAVLAMFHDVLIAVGIFAWLGRPIDGVFLAAALTIIGLSINDTVVVFDRVRWRWQHSTTEEFNDIANRACLETVPRTVNTGLGAMFILAALAVLGGDSLRDFAMALLIGLVVGTYSSVFAATPLVTYLQPRWPMLRAPRVRKVRDPNDTGAVV